MTTTHDTDPNTATIAAAWASSELGQPEREVRYGFPPADPPEFDEQKAPVRRAIVAAALASGVIGGATLGVTLFDFGDSSLPTVVTPTPDRAVVVGPSMPAPAPTQVLPQQAPTVAPAPARAPAAVATPPAPVDGTAVVDIPIPDYPPLPPKPENSDPEPDNPQPEPPNPVPPVPDDLDFKLPEPPKPDFPDLPKAPAPKPDPKPDPPTVPDFSLQAPVKS